MAKQIPFPGDCPLFTGISEADFRKLFGCLRGRHVKLGKGDCLFQEDDSIDKVGLVLFGALNICRDRLDGKTNVIETIETNGTFGAPFSWNPNRKVLGVRIVATCKTEVLVFDAAAVPKMCGNACPCHTQVIRNCLRIISARNFAMVRRIRLLSERTTAQKVMLYLNIRAKMAKSREFDIPVDRQGLANYLCVERSALSAELSKLAKAGKIEYRKNHFKLLK